MILICHIYLFCCGKFLFTTWKISFYNHSLHFQSTLKPFWQQRKIAQYMNYSNSYPWAVKFAENLVHLLLRPPYLFCYHNDLLPVRWEYYWRSSASWQYSHSVRPPRSVQGWVLITYYFHCIKCENLLLVTLVLNVRIDYYY